MAGVSRQAVSAVESGLSDPSLRVALALSRALGLTVEELFGPAIPEPVVPVRAVASLGSAGARVSLAPVGDSFVALPLTGGTVTRAGFAPAGGRVSGYGRGHPAGTTATHAGNRGLRPGPPADRAAAQPAGSAGFLCLVAMPEPGGTEPCRRRARARSWRAPARARRRLQHRAGQGTAARRRRGDRLLLLAGRTGAAAGAGRSDRQRGRRCRRRAAPGQREPGAEARRVLDRELAGRGIDVGQVSGYATRRPGT